MDVDYYEVMGLERTADGAQIKKAYRKLALQFHPDKNNGSEEALEMFKLISQAYEVLSDPERKSTYDRYGKAGLEGGQQEDDSGFNHGGFANFHDPNDIFRMFFGGDPFAGMHHQHGMHQHQHQQQHAQSHMHHQDPFAAFGQPFSSFGGFGQSPGMMMGGGMGMGGSMMSSSTSTGGGMHSFSSRSSSTSITDGRQRTVTTINENGQQREEVEERDLRTGQVLSLTVNGQHQDVQRLTQ